MTNKVPAAPFRRLIDEWCAENPDLREIAGVRSIFASNTQKLCALTGLSKNFLAEIRDGRKELIEFDKADAIVVTLSRHGAFGWWLDAELRQIYEGYDLEALDVRKPTTVDAA